MARWRTLLSATASVDEEGAIGTAPAQDSPQALSVLNAAPAREARTETGDELRHWCLFLDVDGTLLEFSAIPDEVRVPVELRLRLEELSTAFGGALALISGRTLATLDGLFAPLRLPAAGVHGLERRTAGEAVHRVDVHCAQLERARQNLLSLVYRHPALILENKGVALAVHYRRAPELQQLAREHAYRAAAELGAPFMVLEGDMLFEIKPTKPDKASAIESFLLEAPFAGRRPIFVGDDITDRDGFAAVKRHGGLTVGVGERISGDRQLANPRAVRHWLGNLLTAGDPLR